MIVVTFLFGLIVAAGLVFLFLGIGLFGLRRDQRDTTNPLDKESNFWW